MRNALRFVVSFFVLMCFSCARDWQGEVKLGTKKDQKHFTHLQDSVVALVGDRENPVVPTAQKIYCSGVNLTPYVVLTAAHCVKKDDGPTLLSVIRVGSYRDYVATNGTFYNGKWKRYLVVAFDERKDLALLKLESTSSPFPYIETVRIAQRNPQYNDYVMHIGHPVDLAWSVHSGRISYPKRPMREDLSKNESPVLFTQVSAPIYFGNSGGPLLNNRFEIIGVCSYMQSSKAPHLGLFTHLSMIKVFVQEYKERVGTTQPIIKY